MISTASRVGTGNIAGIATAIATGGKGAVFLGAQADFSLIWNIADITMGIMAIVNIVAILLLGKIAIKTLKNYEEQKNAGKNPVFYGSEIGIKGTVWNKKGD